MLETALAQIIFEEHDRQIRQHLRRQALLRALPKPDAKRYPRAQRNILFQLRRAFAG